MQALPPLRDVISRYGLQAKKSLGQNFLLDLNLTGRIARAAGDLSDYTVLEVGPGPGGLTRALLAQGARHVVAIERDPRCIAALGELGDACPGRLTVVEADALEIAERELLAAPAKVIANLPYNIATPLLFKWLDVLELFDSLTLLFQKEVAQRIAAEPRTKPYGRLSVRAQWQCRVKLLFDIPGRAFTPPPKVTSTLIQLIPRPTPLAPADSRALEKVVAACFGQRRKMLRSGLKCLTETPEALLAAAGIQGTARAEELGIEEFCALARAYEAMTG